LRITTLNQRDEIVQVSVNTTIVPRRPGAVQQKAEKRAADGASE
jgi:hypothetical protein